MENTVEVLQKLKTEIPYDPQPPNLGMYPKIQARVSKR
jgi:hypothetical protein